MTTTAMPADLARSTLRACALLRVLDDSVPGALDTLVAAAHRRHYRAGDVVYRTGGPGDAMFVVLSGAVAARACSSGGDVVDIGVCSPGEVFGHLEVVAPGPRIVDAVALRDTAVLVVPARVAVRALRASPQTALALSADLVRIVRAMTTQAADRTFRPVAHRVAALLLDLPHVEGRVAFDGPQVLLAQRLGIARQTLNTALRRLGEQGLLTVHPGGREVTLDRAGLRALLVE